MQRSKSVDVADLIDPTRKGKDSSTRVPCVEDLPSLHEIMIGNGTKKLDMSDDEDLCDDFSEVNEENFDYYLQAVKQSIKTKIFRLSIVAQVLREEMEANGPSRGGNNACSSDRSPRSEADKIPWSDFEQELPKCDLRQLTSNKPTENADEYPEQVHGG